MFLWKTLEDVVEDVDSASIFAWKTQNQLFKLKKKVIFIYWICVFQGNAWEVSTSSRVSSSVFLQNTRVFAMSLHLAIHFSAWCKRPWSHQA